MAERPKANPYPGPRPFRAGETLYGRDREITQLFYLLSAERIVVLHSPSGAGKSSLLHSGLVPRLQRERFDVWPTIRLSAPAADAGNRFVKSAILSLEEGLPPGRQRPVEKIADQSLAQYITERPRRPGAPSSVVLLFDQFEEIVTLDPVDVDAKQEFFRQLGETLKNPGLWALFALREDYLAPLDPYRDDVPTRLSNTFRIDLLSVEAGLEAITQPAHDANREFADEAARKLVEDLATVSVQQPDGGFLKVTGRYVEPVQLQVVCRRLWDELPADSQTIGVEHLQASGNVDAALAAYYDRCVADIARGDAPYERRLREWFSERLITPGGIRGQVLSGQDRSGGLDNASVRRLLDTHLVRSEQRVGAIWYELAHDRLVAPVRGSNRQWFDAKLHSFQKIAAVWEAQHRPDGLLFVGADLDEAKCCAEANGAFVTNSEQSFLEKSREKQLAIEREREVEQEKADAQARYAQRMRWAAVFSSAFAVVAVVLGVLAYKASRNAETKQAEAQAYLSEAQITQSRSLVKEAEQDPNDQSKTILLALEALPDAEEQISRPVVIAAEKILSQGINDLRERFLLKGHTNAVLGVAVTGDGARIVTGSWDNTARVWDASTGAELLQLKGHTGPVMGVAVTPDGARIVTGSDDTTARVWDASTGAELLQFKGHTGPVSGVAVTPDGARIVTGSDDTTARVWDANTGAELLQLKGHTRTVLGVAVTPDGARIVTSSDDTTARVWDASTGAELFQLKGHTNLVRSVAVTPDGARIVTGSDDNTARVWDASTGAELLQLKGHTSPVSGVAITPDGARIVTGSDDTTTRVWDASTGAELLQLKGHTDAVWGVAVTPDGARIVTGSWDNTARVWDASTGAEPHLQVKGHTRAVWGVAVTPDGARIVTSSYDNTARVWDARTGAELLKLEGHTDRVRSVAVTPDGARIVTGSYDNTARVWNASTGAELLQLKGHTRPVLRVAVSPDGARIVTGSNDKTARVWDAGTGKELLQLKGHTSPVSGVAITPDGARIVTGSDNNTDNTVRVWDAGTGEELLQLKGHTDAILDVAVTPDGARIVTGSYDTTVRVWDTSTGNELRQLKYHPHPVWGVAVTPDGTRIVTALEDNTARVWDASTGAELFRLKGHTGPLRGVAVTPDGARIVSSSEDNTARLWDFAQLRPLPQHDPSHTQALVDRGKTVVPRCLTIEQRRTFLLRPSPPRWCIDMGKYPYNTKHWKAFKAGKTEDAVDSATANQYDNFADAALEAGDFKIALEAAELGIKFGPQQIFIEIKRAHALMFLGGTNEKDARDAYLAHRGKTYGQRRWEDMVVDDFQRLRRQDREHRLMTDIEQVFKPSLPEVHK